MDTFGQRLRNRARELGLTDVEVARRVGLSERRYANYVADKREPNFETVRRICEALGVDANFLLMAPTRDRSRKEPTERRILAAAQVLDRSDADLLADFATLLIRRNSKPLRKR